MKTTLALLLACAIGAQAQTPATIGQSCVRSARNTYVAWIDPHDHSFCADLVMKPGTTNWQLYVLKSTPLAVGASYPVFTVPATAIAWVEAQPYIKQ